MAIWEAIQKRSHEPIYKTYTKIEAKGLIAITKGGAMEESPILLSQYWINEEFELIQLAPLMSHILEGKQKMKQNRFLAIAITRSIRKMSNIFFQTFFCQMLWQCHTALNSAFSLMT